MPFTYRDKEIVKELASQLREIAESSIQNEKRAMWTNLNGLKQVRPMVWINEIPWHELAGEELNPQAEEAFVREMEVKLRQSIYLWKHMRTDMVVDPFYISDYVFHDSGHGLDWIPTHDGAGEAGIGSAEYQPVMESEKDLDFIKMPAITPDWDATKINYQKNSELIGDILPIKK